MNFFQITNNSKSRGDCNSNNQNKNMYPTIARKDTKFKEMTPSNAGNSTAANFKIYYRATVT